MKGKLLQWHPAFHAALQIEFEEESHKLSFKNEHMLSSKPLQIDTLVIKVKPGEAIDKNIGRIFRQYNIVEYKNPGDYVSINDYYKLTGYACIYQSDTEKVCEIDPGELTLTFACSHFPHKLAAHLKRREKAVFERAGDGIYYVGGLMFPLQILVIDQLSGEDNFWLNCLRPELDVENEIKPALRRYKGKEKQPLYAAVMDLIVRVNKEKFEEELKMCDALHELLEEKMDEIVEYRLNMLYGDKLKEMEQQFKKKYEEQYKKQYREQYKKQYREQYKKQYKEQYKKQYKEQGIEQGLEQGIEALILDNLEEGTEAKRIIEKLEKRFKLSREKAEEYYSRFAES